MSLILKNGAETLDNVYISDLIKVKDKPKLISNNKKSTETT